MEEPQRSQILEHYRGFNDQFDQSVLRARADLQSGLALEDLIAGGIAEFSKTASVDALAAVVICRILWEAKKPVRAPRKKTAVIAKRSKRKEVSDVE